MPAAVSSSPSPQARALKPEMPLELILDEGTK